jgi:tetratricopeptide (TPR) repeat protein
MKRAFLVLSMMTMGLLPAPLVQAQFEQDRQDERELEIELRYLEDRLYAIGGGSSIVASSEYEALILEADQLFSRYPDSAAVWGMRGIIKYNYQLEMDDVVSLSIAESAKNDLEVAISIDPYALEGEPFIFLGNLYLNQPGWPSGFGDESRAGELLWQAVTLRPDDFDANYFLALYLLKIGSNEEAKTHLERALNAPVSARREGGANARRARIAEMLEGL